jgi:hypothetical protein
MYQSFIAPVIGSMSQSIYTPITPLIPIHDPIFDDINVNIIGGPGATGPQGPTGPPGATGIAGPIGSTGIIGSTGAGATGASGPQGLAGNPSPVTVTDVIDDYTALTTDYFLCVLTVAPVTITLPLGILGTVYVIKDCSGNAANAPITIQGTAQTVDTGTATIDVAFGSVTVVFNGSTWSIT